MGRDRVAKHRARKYSSTLSRFGGTAEIICPFPTKCKHSIFFFFSSSLGNRRLCTDGERKNIISTQREKNKKMVHVIITDTSRDYCGYQLAWVTGQMECAGGQWAGKVANSESPCRPSSRQKKRHQVISQQSNMFECWTGSLNLTGASLRLRLCSNCTV